MYQKNNIYIPDDCASLSLHKIAFVILGMPNVWERNNLRNSKTNQTKRNKVPDNPSNGGM